MVEKMKKDRFPDVKENEWDEYVFIFDLITVEKRNPYLQGYHLHEETYPLLRLIAKSKIREYILRGHLILLLEEGEEE